MKDRHIARQNLKLDLEELNEKIETNDKELDKSNRRLIDRNLLKKQLDATMELKRIHSKIEIDINIGKSKLQELSGLKEMALRAIKDILQEKLIVERANEDLDNRIQGKGISDEESKVKQIDAESSQIKKISNDVKFAQQKAKVLMDQLAEEENNGKAVLDQNHRLQQDLAQKEEDVKFSQEKHAANREELIALRLKLSQLTV